MTEDEFHEKMRGLVARCGGPFHHEERQISDAVFAIVAAKPSLDQIKEQAARLYFYYRLFEDLALGKLAIETAPLWPSEWLTKLSKEDCDLRAKIDSELRYGVA